jgi:outer membrane protein assembly factor BamB
MRFVHLGLFMVALVPVLVLAAAKDDATDPDKVTNDRPDRPLQMPPASSEVKEAFDDFERFSRRAAWERALKALYTIPEAQAGRFVDGEKGFIVPVARKRRLVLAALPPEGQVAYRLLYDDEAKKLLDQAEGSSERKTLERIYSAYFPTSVGDNAADRLGDLYFESGRFDRAADCWLAVLHDRPDTDLSPALLAVKAALALSRASRSAELAELRREVAERYAGDRVSIGGTTAPAGELLRRLLGDDSSAKVRPVRLAGPAGTGLDLSRPVPAAWQMRFSESVVAGMTSAERSQWETNPLSGAVPAVAVVENRLYANFLGYIFALDLETGKLVWRSASFHNLETPASQDMARMLDPARFAIVASKTHVWSLSRELTDPNQMATFRLSCRRADGGDLVWQTSDLPDYAQLDLVGHPVLAGESLFVGARTPMNQQQQPPHYYVLGIRARDGKLLWKTEVGMFRQAQRYFYYGMGDQNPQPRLAYHAGAVYLDTHVGVLARLDADSGELDWGYGYQTEPVQGDRWIIFIWDLIPSDTESAPSAPVRSREAMIVKGAKSERLYAIDPDRMKLLWDRPIATSARLLGANDHALFLGGPELSALDLKTRKLLWATRVPGGSKQGRVLVGSEGIWQLTSRGIFELDPENGEVRRIFRGDDTGSDGGDLLLSDRLLLAVTNRTISAYPVAAKSAGRPGPSAEAGGAASKTRESDD